MKSILRAVVAAGLLLESALLASCSSSSPKTVLAAPSLQSEAAAGGTITLPAGTIDIDCNSELNITQNTTLIGQGRTLTVLNDTCASGSTILVNMATPAIVELRNLGIIHSGGPGVTLTGGTQFGAPFIERVLRLQSVDLQGSPNCLQTDGYNLLFVEESYIHGCTNDGAQIASFAVTFHDNWFSLNGHNGVTFTGAGFCAACTGNEYWSNGGHGIDYEITGTADARHIGDYIDSNGDVGLVVNGVRDFTFNDGWIGTNQNGGAVINSTQIGTVLVGNIFTNNMGPSLTLTQTVGPFRVSGNVDSLEHVSCDATINGKCVDLNTY